MIDDWAMTRGKHWERMSEKNKNIYARRCRQIMSILSCTFPGVDVSYQTEDDTMLSVSTTVNTWEDEYLYLDAEKVHLQARYSVF